MGVALVPDSVDTRYALQVKARHEMMLHLQEDILRDMLVCSIEGWDKMEYINELKELINSFG